MTDGRYVVLLGVLLLSAVVFAAALASGPTWWLTISAVLTGIATGGSAVRERQQRVVERADRCTIASPD